MRTVSLIALLFLIIACDSQAYQKSETVSSGFPSVLESHRLFKLEDPVFMLYYDSSFVSGGKMAVYDLIRPDIVYPLESSYILTVYAPFYSDLLSYSDSVVCFRPKKEFTSNEFAVYYQWNIQKIPESFAWPTDFDDVFLCADRYYDPFLSWQIADYDYDKIVRLVEKKGHRAISENWRQFLEEIDPVSWNVLKDSAIIISHKSVCVLLKDWVKKRIKSNTHNECFLAKDSLLILRDKTRENLRIDSLGLFVPKTNRRHQFFFSFDVVRDCIQYPLFQMGMNCYALEVISNPSLEHVSRLISEDDYGAVYYVPSEYNQNIYPIYVMLDPLVSSYYLVTFSQNTEIVNDNPNLSSEVITERTVAEDSIFYYGNRLIKVALQLL